MAYTSVTSGSRILASTINDLIKYALNPGIVRLAQASAQSIPDATATALTFAGTDDIDVYGFHDPTTNNTRITPNIPGTYFFFGAYYTDSATTGADIDCSIRKNGGTVLPTGSRAALPSTLVVSQDAQAVFDMNGSTDYVELMAFQNSSGAVNSRVNARFTSHFSCYVLGYSL